MEVFSMVIGFVLLFRWLFRIYSFERDRGRQMGPKLGAVNSIQLSYWGGRNQIPGPIIPTSHGQQQLRVGSSNQVGMWLLTYGMWVSQLAF